MRTLDDYVPLRQEQTNWCWAATTKAAADFYHSSSHEQCDIANLHFGRDFCCSRPSDAQCNKYGVLEKSLKDHGLHRRTTTTPVLSSLVLGEMNARRPVGVRFQFGKPLTDAAHFVTIVGADAAGNVLISDSADQSVQETTLAELADTYRFEDGIWTHTYLMVTNPATTAQTGGSAATTLGFVIQADLKRLLGPGRSPRPYKLQREPTIMLENLPSLKIPVLDYTIQDVAGGRPLDKAGSRSVEARLGKDTLSIRTAKQPEFKHVGLDNVEAQRRISTLLGSHREEQLRLVRITGMQVWALWDQGRDELFPVYYRTIRFPLDHYSKSDFFASLGAQAASIVENFDEARRLGTLEQLGN